MELVSNIGVIISILATLFAFVGFGITVFTERSPAEVLRQRMLRSTPHPPTPLAGTPSPPLTTRQSWQRLMPPHPWLLGMALLAYLLNAVTPDPATAGFALIAVWIAGPVVAAKGRNWVWFVVIIVTLGFGTIFFSIFAEPKKQGVPPTKGTVEPPQSYPYPSPVPVPWATLIGPQGSLNLSSSTVNIGRGPQNQLNLSDPQVSHVHAQIYPQGQNHIVVDLGSANGTFVNEQRLPPKTAHLLRVGDRVRFGQTVFTYTMDSSLYSPPTVVAPTLLANR
jgi:hypothetical protein